MNVLIVDDNQLNLELFAHMLGMIDVAVPVPMDDPLEALRWCEGQTPDLVVLDYMMPGMNGIDFLKRFRALPGKLTVPVVVVTADTEMQVRYEALRLGANDFLTKPVNSVEFNVRIGNLLALRAAQVQLTNRAETLAEAVDKATAAIVEREHEAIHRLSRAAEFRDTDTGAHLLRMSAYARLIARKMGLSEVECELIFDAAPMHDIGKVGIPDRILLKKGPLTDEEFVTMRTHAQIGADILEASESPLLQAGALIAISHHERYDGRGYPNGLVGEEIPLYGRIIAVADVFDALTSVRPYKNAWELSRALAYMKDESGKHFDPACVSAFLSDLDAVMEIHNKYDDARYQ